MLDLSIKELKKALSSQKKQVEFLRKRITVTEKFDGTKLTLIRNGEPYDADDYTKNWIVAYKGNVLFPGEYAGIADSRFFNPVSHFPGDIERGLAIGTSQYGYVHRHLKSINKVLKTIPKNTEFFVEFIQNKHTLTRDYGDFHDMFLLGYAQTDFIVYGQRVFTTAQQMQTERVDAYASDLRMRRPPVVFEGPASELGTVEDITTRYEDMKSCLGGKAEGVVIKTYDGDLYKVVSPDQYDKELRAEKKMRWSLGFEKETEYWSQMGQQAELILQKIPSRLSTNNFLRELSEAVYGLKDHEIKAQNRKKALIVLQDDLFLTAKLRFERVGKIPYDAHSIGMFVMSGKPVHNGHWKMISMLSEQNSIGYVYVSVKDRGLKDDDTIHGGDALKVWKDFLLSRLPENIVVRFSENPRLDALRDIQAFQDDTERKDLFFNYYADSTDAAPMQSLEEGKKWFPIVGFNRYKIHAIDRNDTELISGTKMRWMLRNGEPWKNQFMMHLPSVLQRPEREKIWDLYRSRL